MVDYARTLATAQRLIATYGRLVDFHKQATGFADANKPLHGAATPPAPVEGVPAAFVEPSSVIRLGASTTLQSLWEFSTQIMLVAPDGVNDLTTFTTVTDSDGSEWKIDHTEKLQPGPIALLYFIGVKR